MQFDDQGIRGPDVSFYQGNPRDGLYIDFQKMKNYGVDFVIIRAGQWTWKDPAFDYNWQEAKRVGIPRATYFFLDERGEGRAQAELFWSIIQHDPGEGPLVVDFEWGSGDWHRLYDFIVRLKELSGYPSDRIWIYTGYYYWLQYGPRTAAELQWFQIFPMWLAAYASSPANVLAPAGFVIPLWQKGTLIVWGPDLGVHSLELDWNIFNGGRDKFTVYFNAGEVPPPQGGNTMQYKVIWSRGAARRTAPTVSNSYTGLTYEVNTIVPVVQDNIPDRDDPTNLNKRWVEFADGLFGASNYPNSIGVPSQRMEKVIEPPPPNPQGPAYSFKVDGYNEVAGVLEPE